MSSESQASPGRPSHSEAGPVVDIRELVVSLTGTEILHGVSLSAKAGEAVAILGGNGSGKSTLVRALVGAIPADSGELNLFGGPATASARARLGYVPQRVSAISGVAATAREVVMSGLLGSRMLRTPRDGKAAADAALAQLGIADLAARSVTELSGGQQQRVLISRALVREPALLVLDEPMAGVDVPSQEALAKTLAHLKESGVTILIVLHELGVLAGLIDRAVVLDKGCVTHEGAPPADLGVHALPGHDHIHPHDDVPASSAALRMDVAR